MKIVDLSNSYDIHNNFMNKFFDLYEIKIVIILHMDRKISIIIGLKRCSILFISFINLSFYRVCLLFFECNVGNEQEKQK